MRQLLRYGNRPNIIIDFMKTLELKTFAVVDRQFPSYLANFFYRKLHENERICTKKGGHAWHHPYITQ